MSNILSQLGVSAKGAEASAISYALTFVSDDLPTLLGQSFKAFADGVNEIIIYKQANPTASWDQALVAGYNVSYNEEQVVLSNQAMALLQLIAQIASAFETVASVL